MGPATAIPLPRCVDRGSLQEHPAIVRRRMASSPLHRPGRIEPALVAALALSALAAPLFTVWLAALAGAATAAVAVTIPHAAPRVKVARRRVPQPAGMRTPSPI